GVIAQRDDRNNQVLQLQQDVNYFRQQNANLQNQVNQLIQERDTLQNRVNQLIPERDTLQNRVNQLISERDTLRNRINQLARDLNNSQQGYILRGRLWHNASLIWNEQSKLKRTLEIIYKSTQPTSSRRQEGRLLRPSQMEPGEIYRGPNLRLNDPEWLRMDEATDRLSALAGWKLRIYALGVAGRLFHLVLVEEVALPSSRCDLVNLRHAYRVMLAFTDKLNMAWRRGSWMR
ncbi:8633_t:CDS:2, partial [Paraglomus occultum]